MNAGKQTLILLLTLFVIFGCARNKESKNQDIKVEIASIFDLLKSIEMMTAGKEYIAMVEGKEHRGKKEFFLRKRSGQEIIESGLSSGCGDYAFAFNYLIKKRGFKTKIVDGVRISLSSLITHFDGHMLVAVKDRKLDRWYLVDPTERTIVSDNWSTDRGHFHDGRYWIGFVGSVESYPAKNQQELKAFYRQTLAKIPQKVLNTRIIGMEIEIDKSLVSRNGTFKNQQITSFLARVKNYYENYHLEPINTAKIRFVKGEDNVDSSVEHVGGNKFVCPIGLQSGLSDRFLFYLEGAIHSRMKS